MEKKGKAEAVKSADLSPDLAAADFQTFALEYEEDKRGMRWAIGAAVILHIVFFLIHLPEIQAEDFEKKKAKVYVVQQVRFKPPPPKQQQEIPKPRSKKVLSLAAGWL